MNTIQEIANVLKSVKSAVIFTHTRPDGDAVGSAVALSRALSYLKIENEIVNDSILPAKFLYLVGKDEFKKAPTLDAEAFVCVDCSDEARLGQLQDTYLRAARKKVTVNVDHHISNTRFAKYNFVRECSSNCQNIFELIEALSVPLDREIANALMTGLITDSGNFSHNDVDGDTFRIAAKAADAGANCDLITYETFKKQPRSRAELYARTIGKLRYFLENRLAFSIVTQEDLKACSATPDLTEGFVDFALTVDTVEVSIALLEMRKGQYKASLRSKGRANVNRIASVYGGGGHVLAAGCMLYGDLEEILDKLQYTVSQYLED